jgi:hypothetical protein
MAAAHAQAQSYKSQQQAANYNAEANRQNALSAEAAASANELAQRRQQAQEMGTERARMAESGGLNGGTGTGVLAQSGTNLELSALNTRYQGAMQARGLLAGVQMDQFQANVAGQNASAATTAGYFNAASSALGSTANYYNTRSLMASG